MDINEQIKVMQHFANGGKIESIGHYASSFWCENCTPSWDWEHASFRIKKEPRTFYIGVYNLGYGIIHYIVDNKNDPNRVNNTLPVEIIEVTESV